MDKFPENCAVIGFYSNKKCAGRAYGGLHEMYGRGQESCGLTGWTAHGLVTVKKMQSIVTENVFTADDIRKLDSSSVIGHNRYSTAGFSVYENAQPFEIYSKFDHAIAHNGTIRNAGQLRDELIGDGHSFSTKGSDTEIMGKMIAGGKDVIDGIKLASRYLEGSWSIVILAKEGVYGARDPYGIKPLALGRDDNGYCLASESCAFSNPSVNMKLARDVKPGEVILLNADGAHTVLELPSPRKALCVFEYIYFARPDSILDGRVVSDVRKKLGRALAKRDNFANDGKTIVTPVPYSAIDYAIGYAQESCLPYEEIFLRKRHVQRSFIAPEQERREDIAREKISLKPGYAKGKRIILLEDSLVRGTTLKTRVIEPLIEEGADEIHARSGFSKITHHCPHGGIDMKANKELLAHTHPETEEMKRYLGLRPQDSVTFNETEDIVGATGFSANELCLYCITGEYPLQTRIPL